MAGSAPMEPAPKLGKGATLAGFVFVVLILSAFGFSTAVSHEDKVEEIHAHHDDDHGDDHGDDHADDDHGDDHADDDHGDDHADDDHGDDHADDDHSGE